MATEDHKRLAFFLKEVHSTLRKSSAEVGAEKAWESHCKNEDILKQYARCMERLAITHWAENCNKDSSEAKSRIQWATNFTYDYFVNKAYTRHRQKEIEIAQKIDIKLSQQEELNTPLRLLDVGSCYNPFKIYEFFEVTAIDLCPANDSVFVCDFLKVTLGSELHTLDNKLLQLPETYFNVVTFCFLLEYIPSSELRVKACEKAYEVLNPGGILVINTPDSKHVGANSKLMKCWQYTLARIGFIRIKYEKLKHMHCMAFRKAVCKEVASRWVKLHENANMEFALYIPQDFNHSKEAAVPLSEVGIKSMPEDFQELPFCYGV